MSDISFHVLLRLADETVANTLVNTLDPYPDETMGSFKEQLLESVEEVPRFSDYSYEDTSKEHTRGIVFSFSDDAFLASETIGEIAHQVGCQTCIAMEHSDTRLFIRYQEDGTQTLLFADDEEYDYELSGPEKEGAQEALKQGSKKLLTYLANLY